MKLTAHEYRPAHPDLVMVWVNDREDGCLECVPRDLAAKIIGWNVESIAKTLWQRDYPTGGSMYRTYESTPFHDKEIYRREAQQRER